MRDHITNNIYTPRSVRAAFSYANTCRNQVKKQYVKAVTHARLDGAGDDPNPKGELSYMAAQGVRMDLDGILVRERPTS